MSKKTSKLYWNAPARWFVATLSLFVLILLSLRTSAAFELDLAEQFFQPFACSDGVLKTVYLTERCGAFTLKWSPAWSGIRDIGFNIPVVAMILLLAWLYWPPAPHEQKTVQDVSLPALGILSVLLGPMLMVNMIMKPLFGRPRPAQVDWFGGEWTYILPGDFQGQCSGNCSFVSGEAASAFWMLWIIPFLPARWRWIAGISITLFAIGVSGLRVAFGGHFFSDVVLGGLVSAVAICASVWFLQSARGLMMLRKFCVLYNRRFAGDL